MMSTKTTDQCLLRQISYYLVLVFLIPLISHLIGPNVLACTCSPEVSAPACQLTSRSPVVFLGESIELIPTPKGGRGHVYRFRVERVYKGLDPKIQEVIVNPDNYTSCGTEYPTGIKYIMFAHVLSEEPLMLIAGACSGSRPARFNKSDVEYLEDYVKGEGKTSVYGKVMQWVTDIGKPTDDESAPLEGAKVILENKDNRFTYISQPDGSFNFTGIPPGEYSLSAQFYPYTPRPASYQISISSGGCKEVFIQLKGGASVKGVLLTPDGKPASRTRVELLRKNQKGKWYSTYKMWTQTNEQGIFRFDDLESGDYLLGYEIWADTPSNSSAYPTRYFPGVANRASAEVITLEPDQALTDLKLILPPPHTKRKITIKVIWPDGSPPGNNLLQIFNQTGLLKNLEGSGHNGVFTFEGYQERSYEFGARYWIDNLGDGGPVYDKRIAKSDTVKLAAGKDEAEVVLVLRHKIKSKDEP